MRTLIKMADIIEYYINHIEDGGRKLERDSDG